jgi:hypothetical protein
MCADPKLRTRLLHELAGELAARRRDRTAHGASEGPLAQGWMLKGMSVAASAAAMAMLAAAYF